MADIADRIKAYLSTRGMKASALAVKAGVSREGVYKILKRERRQPQVATLRKLAAAMGISLQELTGDTTDGSIVRIPIMGEVPCGVPTIVLEESTEYITRPTSVIPPGDTIAVYIHGDSMNAAGLRDGDLAIIHLQDTVESGELAAVCIGEASTIKRVIFADDMIVLKPDSMNKEYRSQVYEENEVRIVGKVIGTHFR